MDRLIGVMLLTLASTVAAAGPSQEELLRQSDTLAGTEAASLRAAYEAGSRYLQQGQTAAAFNEFDYAALHGSVAAAARLCVMDGYGIATPPNAVKAEFWCERAAESGLDLAGVGEYLQRQWVAAY